MHLGATFQYCTCHLWSPITDRQSVTSVTIQPSLAREDEIIFWALITCKVLPCPCWFQLSLCKKTHSQNICTFPSLTVFKKVVNSSLEGSMRLISSHPHDAKIGSLDQDHYFTVWCFQDCGEIVERHWADCRRVFAHSSEIKVIIEVDTARSLRQQPSRVSCAAICRPFICQATSYQPLSRVRCPYQHRFPWSRFDVSRGNAQFDFCEICQTHVGLIRRHSCWNLVKL